MTRAGHLVRRFAASLHPRTLDAADLDLVREALQPAELACWERLGRADRAESLATARATIAALGADPDPDYLAAALLHDVGKAATRLGVFGRSWATAAATVAGARRARAWTGVIGQYVNHDELGAARLEEAGARPVAVSWARAHHRPALWPEAGIPPAICAVLARADGESYPE
jgi:putative nucleotidyltransferase with HDIG domain